jgi:hypothetical protein
VVRAVFGFCGERLRGFGMDKTGNGLPMFQFLRDEPVAVKANIPARLAGTASPRSCRSSSTSATRWAGRSWLIW